MVAPFKEMVGAQSRLNAPLSFSKANHPPFPSHKSMFLGVTDNDLLHIKDHLSYNFEYIFENIFEFFKRIIHHRSPLISSTGTVYLFMDDSVLKNYKIES